MKQTNKLHIGISTELKQQLQKEAEACSMTLNQFCLYILSNYKKREEYVD